MLCLSSNWGLAKNVSDIRIKVFYPQNAFETNVWNMMAILSEVSKNCFNMFYVVNMLLIFWQSLHMLLLCVTIRCICIW